MGAEICYLSEQATMIPLRSGHEASKQSMGGATLPQMQHYKISDYGNNESAHFYHREIQTYGSPYKG